jgi:anti-sigma regulatory factor (Ser/Thr protein kinase)
VRRHQSSGEFIVSPAVLTTRVEHLDLAAVPSAAGLARQFVINMLAGSGVREDITADAAQVVSELVTNAGQHAVPPIDPRSSLCAQDLKVIAVSLHVQPNGFVVEVLDPDLMRHNVPHVCRPSDNDEHGRGLSMVVAKLASTWGVRKVNGGKGVWARFDLSASGPDARLYGPAQ